MYGAIVRRRVRAVFELMNAGEWRAIGATVADDVRHVTWGGHPLSGERCSRAAFEAWLRRVLLLLPGLRFQVTRVATVGGPWNTWAVAEWTDRAVLVDGSLYQNAGTTWINIRWGRVVEMREYMDTEAVADACRRVAAAGVEEGAAAPLLD
ncbi:MAG TPA: nuclear transport factor 2 family protein [Solirubrobacterales bacterium]|jgi:ketosteroid isomerase-like protein|nr:nuclear transport factor 2 family protein [Solirubrobacterales bacterium]